MNLQEMFHRYLAAETSEAEEQALRQAAQDGKPVPEAYGAWSDIFEAEEAERRVEMPASLAEKLQHTADVIERLGHSAAQTASGADGMASAAQQKPSGAAQTASASHREPHRRRRALRAFLRPFTQSACAVAILTLVGLAAQEAFAPTDEEVRTEQFNAQEWTLRHTEPAAPLEADASLPADTASVPEAMPSLIQKTDFK